MIHSSVPKQLLIQKSCGQADVAYIGGRNTLNNDNKNANNLNNTGKRGKNQ